MSWELCNDILFWLLAVVLAWNAYILVFHKGVPNIGTAPAIQQEIIAALRARFGDAPFSVVDLGSGDGKFTRAIARNLPQAQVLGLESAPQSYFSSKLLGSCLKNLAYKRGDFFKHDLSGADAVVMYQSVFLMEKIGQKLAAELKPGALVACNRFPLGGWEAQEHKQIKTLYPHQKDLYIYSKA